MIDESSGKPGMKDKPSQIGCFKNANETTSLIRNAEILTEKVGKWREIGFEPQHDSVLTSLFVCFSFHKAIY